MRDKVLKYQREFSAGFSGTIDIDISKNLCRSFKTFITFRSPIIFGCNALNLTYHTFYLIYLYTTRWYFFLFREFSKRKLLFWNISWYIDIYSLNNSSKCYSFKFDCVFQMKINLQTGRNFSFFKLLINVKYSESMDLKYASCIFQIWSHMKNRNNSVKILSGLETGLKRKVLEEGIHIFKYNYTK